MTRKIDIRFQQLAEIMMQLVPVPLDMLKKSRKQPLPYCRNIIWDRMMKDGFSTPAIGKATGHNHVTVLNGAKRLRWIVGSPGWTDVSALYSEFTRKIAEIDELEEVSETLSEHGQARKRAKDFFDWFQVFPDDNEIDIYDAAATNERAILRKQVEEIKATTVAKFKEEVLSLIGSGQF